MTNKLICPILTAARMTASPIKPVKEDCLEECCAWWQTLSVGLSTREIKNLEGCAIGYLSFLPSEKMLMKLPSS